MSELEAWLAFDGFKFGKNSFNRHNDVGWYAYRRSAIKGRECECNDGKPMQIVVHPYAYPLGGIRHESVEVEVCGEFSGTWWKLQSYSLKPGELIRRLPEIEASLLRAWEALA